MKSSVLLAVIERIGELAASHTDHQIAGQLNREGLSTGVGQAFSKARVRRVRVKYGIPSGCPDMPTSGLNGQRGDGCYSSRAAAGLLNVSVGTIGNWCGSGKLDFVQSFPGSPRWIELTLEIIARLRKPAHRT